MTTQAERSRLAEVKLALARKHERLAKVAKSLPKQKKHAREARKYHRQVEMLSLGSGLKDTK